ncbi:MAG: PQQ-binding-like beta-propeller repeat protein [Actinomycetota bacterium]|nr:PQQ-binding-like beta-propeller repeat protein [Actinomycetota bacterium]
MPVDTQDERGLPDDETAESPRDLPGLQPGAWVGLVVGLLIVAIVALAWAWLRRTPPEVVNDLVDTMSVLRQTSLVVAIGCTLVVVYLAAGAYRSDEAPPRHFVALTAPTLAIVGVVGIVLWRRPETQDAFDGAAYEQRIPGSGNVQSVASVAWSACLAVLAVAFMALRAYRPFYEKMAETTTTRRPVPDALAIISVLVVAGGVVIGMATHRPSPYEGETATGVAIPPIPDRPGRGSYSLESPSQFTIGGAGYAVVGHSSDDAVTSYDTIEGYDGATGDRLWWFAVRDTDVSELWSTGAGPDSVLVAKIYGDGISGSPFIGIDATTGERLWTTWLDPSVDPQEPFDLLADKVILVRHHIAEADTDTSESVRERWIAFSPQTGETLWTRPLPKCQTEAFAASDSVVMSACPDDPDHIATVLDATTGDVQTEIRKSSLGVQLPDDTVISIEQVRDSHALVSMSDPTEGDSITYSLIDVGTGREIHRFAKDASVSFVGDGSIVIRTRHTSTSTSISLFDIDSRITLPTGLVTEKSARTSLPWTALGDAWVGVAAQTPPDSEDAIAREDSAWDYSLWTVTRDGEVSQMLDPCTPYNVGDLRTMPGALVMWCPDSMTAMN